MEIIKSISQKIDGELEDAQKYIKCAYHVRDEYPRLADTYYQLSLEEMKHTVIVFTANANIMNASTASRNTSISGR